MGLRIRYIEYMNKFIIDEFGSHKDLSMLELGNQVIRKRDRSALGCSTGKEYFSNRGMKHSSIDLNGMDGAMAIDLSMPIKEYTAIGKFDVITNSGTTEHVEPFSSQYQCFKNIHDLMKVGGISIHLIPDIHGAELKNFFKQRHCNNYYSEDFFKMLCAENDYKLLDSRRSGAYRRACVKKMSNNKFMSDKSLFLSKVSRREDGRVYSYKDGGFNFG